MSSTGYLRKSLLSFSHKETELEKSPVQVSLTSQACVFHSPGVKEKKPSFATFCKLSLYTGNCRLWLPMGLQFSTKIPNDVT